MALRRTEPWHPSRCSADCIMPAPDTARAARRELSVNQKRNPGIWQNQPSLVSTAEIALLVFRNRIQSSSSISFMLYPSLEADRTTVGPRFKGPV